MPSTSPRAPPLCRPETFESIHQYHSCIPWDFPLTTNLGDECDVFGRTCFYNAMKQTNLNETGEPSITNITVFRIY